MVYQTSTNMYSYSKYIVDNSAGSTTYTTIQAAINDANTYGGGTILIRPGTYVENLTLYSLVNLEGASGSELTGGVTITGIHTPPAAGNFSAKRIYFTSATHVFSSAVAGTTTLSLESCRVNCTNGYLFNLPNWTGNIDVDDVFTSSAADGFCNSTSTAPFYVINSSIGAGANAMIISGGTAQFINTAIQCPQTFNGTANVVFKNCTVTTAQTYSVNAVGRSTDTAHIMTVAADVPITTTSAGAITLENVTIDSTAVNVIAGTGPVTFGSVTYVSSTGVAGTVVKDFTTRFETGVLKIDDASTGALMATTGVVTAGTLPVGYGGTGQTSFTDHAVLVGSGAAGITAIPVGTTGQLLGGLSGADPAFTQSSNGDFAFTSATPGTSRVLTVSNTDNTNVGSIAHLQVTTGGANAGDPFVNFLINGLTQYSVGIDNSDSDRFVITSGANPSAATRFMFLDSTAVNPYVTWENTWFVNNRWTNAGGNVGVQAINDDNTNGASQAYFHAEVGGGTAGDPYVNFLVSGAGTWSIGIDNSDSDTFKITTGASTSAGTDVVKIDSASGTITHIGH